MTLDAGAAQRFVARALAPNARLAEAAAATADTARRRADALLADNADDAEKRAKKAKKLKKQKKEARHADADADDDNDSKINDQNSSSSSNGSSSSSVRRTDTRLVITMVWSRTRGVPDKRPAWRATIVDSGGGIIIVISTRTAPTCPLYM